jgi:SAM-dependent methyltransferase
LELMTAEIEADGQVASNLSMWARGRYVRRYAHSVLLPPELAVLDRHGAELRGDVLELGCGAGRLTERLIGLGGKVHGIDISPAMVAFCRRNHPGATFSVLDMRDTASFADASFDAIVGTDNVIDVLDDPGRRALLAELARILRPGGLLVLSTHNLAYRPHVAKPTDVRSRNLVRAAAKLLLMPWRMYNHLRLRRHERAGPGYAIVNDDAHHYKLLHYYVAGDTQLAQLDGAGLELVECLDGDGHAVDPRRPVERWPSLFYVARRPQAPA